MLETMKSRVGGVGSGLLRVTEQVGGVPSGGWGVVKIPLCVERRGTLPSWELPCWGEGSWLTQTCTHREK